MPSMTNSARVRSEKFDVANHVVRGQDIVEQHKGSQHVGHLSRSATDFFAQLGRGPTPQFGDIGFVGPDGLVHCLTVIIVICQSGVHVGQGQSMLGGDLIRAQAHALMPDHDVLYGNAMSGYPRLAACNFR